MALNNALRDPQHLMDTVTDTVPYTDSRQNNNTQLTCIRGMSQEKKKKEKNKINKKIKQVPGLVR